MYNEIFINQLNSGKEIILYPPSQKTTDVLRQAQAVRGSEEPSGSRRDGERSRTISLGMNAKKFLLRRDSAPDEAQGEDTPGVSPRELHQAPPPQKPKVKIIKNLAGLLLVVIAILAPISILGPVISAEINYRFLSPKQDQNAIISKIENISSLEPIGEDAKQILTPKDQNFSLIIPKIRLNVPVIPNVDPANEKAYNPALKGGVAQAKGSVFPGEKGTIYIFGHSSNYAWEAGSYKTAFYLLKDLKENDVIVVSYNSKLFVYQIIDKKEVGKGDISWLLPQGEERLVLQTCWPPSTDWRRLVIIAKPLETNQNNNDNSNSVPDNVPGDSKATLSYNS